MKMIEKILNFIIWLLNRWNNRDSLKTLGAARSPQWGKVRNEYLRYHPECAVCGKSEELNVHHKLLFSRHPELELVEENLITLCEAPGREHHLNFGHLGSYKSFNSEVDKDCEVWREKIKTRP